MIFYSKNTPEIIFKLFSKNIKQFLNPDEINQVLIRNKKFEKEDSSFKKLLNFISGKYYFLNQNHKTKFVKNFF